MSFIVCQLLLKPNHSLWARFSLLRRHLNNATLKESKVSLNSGHNVKYLETGDGDLPVLLMAGALGTAKSDFSPQLEGLNKSGRLKVIAWDPPGYGESRPPERTWPQTPNFFYRDADVAIELMSKLGHPRFSIVGWSDGAITGLVAAGRYQKNVSKLVSFAGNAYITDQDYDMLSKVVDVSKWSQRMREPMEKIYGKDYFPVLWKQWIDAYFALQAANGDICKEVLRDIECPTLIIQGAKDAMVSDEHPHHLAKNIKNSRVEIFPEGKHNLHFKFCEDFNRIVEEFLLQ